MATSLFYLALVAVFCSSRVSSQQVVEAGGSCAEKTLCRECIRLPGCLWCSQTAFDGPRCVHRESTNANNCSLAHKQDPHSYTVNPTMVQSEQIAPSSIQMELRVGEPQNFTVQVTPDSDYPLDLYILMDLSRSMQGDLDRVRELIDDLTTRLDEITTNYRLGFGAYNEKPIVPFVTPGGMLYVPQLGGLIASTDYSYRHVVSLTDNITIFRNSIDAINTTVNNERPEALLEALVQVAVCKDVIGWRVAARKLILVMTDAGFHVAGDGRLLGLSTRSDGACHVPSQNASGLPVDYQGWNVYDYPSVGQVQEKLRENDIVLIIAATRSVQTLYETVIREQLTGAYFQLLEQVNVVQGREGNFLSVIESSYNTTSQTVELVPSPAQGVTFAVTANCLDAVSLGNNICGEVRIGQTVSFDVQVTLTTCLSNDPSSVIHIPGFGTIDVQINGICNCSCEAETESNSTECRGYGDLSCGVCDCYAGRFGSQCQCTSEAAVDQACPVGGPQNLECTGRGLCECGVCICEEPDASAVTLNVTRSRPMYFGDACECDNFNCPSINEQVCSGRGECSCGMCTCDASTLDGLGPRYRGLGCECSTEEEVCLNPADNLTCSDHGRCICDGCFCDEGYGGEFCNVSTVILSLDCNARTCVECVKGIVSTPDCRTMNCSERVVLIDEVVNQDQDYTIDGLDTRECSFVDSSGCRHFYFVAHGGQIEAEKTQACSGYSLAIPIWSIATIIVGGLLLIGLLVVVAIKLVLIWLERREYNSWKRELEEADFGVRENKLYTSCRQDYTNVAYQETSNDDKLRGKYSPLQEESSVADTTVVVHCENEEKETSEDKACELVDICESSERNTVVGKETAFDNPAYVPAMELLGTYQLTTEL